MTCSHNFTVGEGAQYVTPHKHPFGEFRPNNARYPREDRLFRTWFLTKVGPHADVPSSYSSVGDKVIVTAYTVTSIPPTVPSEGTCSFRRTALNDGMVR